MPPMPDPHLLQTLASALNLRGQSSRTARRFRTMLVLLATCVAAAAIAAAALLLLLPAR